MINLNQHQVQQLEPLLILTSFCFPVEFELAEYVLLYYLTLCRFLMKLHCGVQSVTTLLIIGILAFLLFE